MWNIDWWPFWQAQEAALVEGWHLSICLAGLPSCLTPLQSILFAPHLIQTAKAHHLHHHLQIQTQCIKVVILRNWWVIGWVAVTSSWLAENGRCDQWVDHFCMPALCLKGYLSKQQGRKGWCSTSARTCLQPLWPRFKSTRWHHTWVEFVVGSLPCFERLFSGYSGFCLTSKGNISKFQFDQESVTRQKNHQVDVLPLNCYLI